MYIFFLKINVPSTVPLSKSDIQIIKRIEGGVTVGEAGGEMEIERQTERETERERKKKGSGSRTPPPHTHTHTLPPPHTHTHTKQNKTTTPKNTNKQQKLLCLHCLHAAHSHVISKAERQTRTLGNVETEGVLHQRRTTA